MSIVLVTLSSVLVLREMNFIGRELAAAVLGGGGLIGAISLIDDLCGLKWWVRAIAHFGGSGFAVWSLGGMAIDVGRWTLGPCWVSNAAAIVGLVWMVNLYNFMDGIDGLAGAQGAYVGLAGGTILTTTSGFGMSLLSLLLGGACLGFLVWNWPPAKIFMGDVGSGFLGFVFGVLAISSAKERPWLLWPWLILLSVFIVDSTLTLMRRLIMGARWHEAHCSHAYQHAARRWGSHAKVTLTIAAVNVAWLFPLGWGACVWPAAGPVLAVVALAPLVYMAFRYDAGQEPSATEVAYSEVKVRAAAASQA